METIEATRGTLTGAKTITASSAISSSDQAEIDSMNAVLVRQKQAHLDDGPVSAEVRIDRLERAYRMIGENQEAIIDACVLDFGNRSRHQTRMTDIMAVMDAMKYNSAHLKKWMKSDRRKVMFPMNLFGAKARVEYQPKGVVGVIGTWNVPVYVSISPLAGIFAAGNRAMVKLSEITPASSNLLKELIAKYFDESECVGVIGGPEVGAKFSGLPLDHIIFTGATGVGRHILRAAAENLTPVTLELGGKSPVIISRSYETKKAAERIMVGKALNMGQTCLCPDYSFIPTENKEDFISCIINQFSQMFPTILDNPDYTSVINSRHHQRITAMIQDAKDKGGDVREINPANEDFSKQKDGLHKIPMTLIIDPSDDMLVMQEELFGPIFCIKTYNDISECIQYVNAKPRPLGLYYFGEDSQEERYVVERTISGGVSVNDVLAHVSCEDLPFGGIGNSGMGNYHGFDGFLTFSHQKPVFRQTKINLMKLAGMIPPYGEKCEKQLDSLCKVK